MNKLAFLIKVLFTSVDPKVSTRFLLLVKEQLVCDNKLCSQQALGCWLAESVSFAYRPQRAEGFELHVEGNRSCSRVFVPSAEFCIILRWKLIIKFTLILRVSFWSTENLLWENSFMHIFTLITDWCPLQGSLEIRLFHFIWNFLQKAPACTLSHDSLYFIYTIKHYKFL